MPDETKPEETYRKYAKDFLAVRGKSYDYGQDIEACMDARDNAERRGLQKSQDEMLFLKVFHEEFEEMFRPQVRAR